MIDIGCMIDSTVEDFFCEISREDIFYYMFVGGTCSSFLYWAVNEIAVSISTYKQVQCIEN